MNRRLIAALTASLLVVAACNGGGAETTSGFALGEEAFTLSAKPTVLVNETGSSTVADSGYALVAGAGVETLYRLPTTRDGAVVALGSCSVRCLPLGFAGEQLLLQGVFSGSDAAISGGNETIDLAFSAESPSGFAVYSAAAGTVSLIKNGSTDTRGGFTTPLLDLFADKGTYAIEAPSAGEQNLIRLFSPAEDGSVEWSGGIAEWGSPISAERYGDGTRCGGGICAAVESDRSLYIAFGSGEIVAYDLATGKEQETPAPYQLSDGLLATSFFRVNGPDLLVLAESETNWLVIEKRPGTWTPRALNTGRLLLQPSTLAVRGGQIFYAAASDSTESTVVVIDQASLDVKQSLYTTTDGNTRSREPIVFGPESEFASFVGSRFSRTVVIDAQGRLFALAGDKAFLIETAGPVVDLITLGTLLFVGQTGDDGRISYAPLNDVGRSDESAAFKRARALAAATTVAGGTSMFDYPFPDGRMNEKEPAFFGRSH